MSKLIPSALSVHNPFWAAGFSQPDRDDLINPGRYSQTVSVEHTQNAATYSARTD